MPGHLLDVPLHRMQQGADCLAACAAMVLDYIGHPMAYPELLHLLDVGEYGAPASRITRLASRSTEVEYGEGTLERLEAYINDDRPVIVLVRTGELTYWHDVDTFHSVVVVGYDQTHVFVNRSLFRCGSEGGDAGRFSACLARYGLSFRGNLRRVNHNRSTFTFSQPQIGPTLSAGLVYSPQVTVISRNSSGEAKGAENDWHLVSALCRNLPAGGMIGFTCGSPAR